MSQFDPLILAVRRSTTDHVDALMISSQRLKTGFLLLFLFMLASLLPAGPVDPWNLIHAKKIAFMIFALVFVQAMGLWLNRTMGARLGSIFSGFLGGLISSTATIASIARTSKNNPGSPPDGGTLTFLSATLAMLFEGMAILYLGLTEVRPALFLLFLGPVCVTLIMILIESRQPNEPSRNLPETGPDMFSLLKLSSFVIGLLIFSKILQRLVGPGALLALTFVVSLFEIHGSIIANVQLLDDGLIRAEWLGGLLGISLVASYLSKLFIALTLGSALFKRSVGFSTLFLLLSLALSWLGFHFFI